MRPRLVIPVLLLLAGCTSAPPPTYRGRTLEDWAEDLTASDESIRRNTIEALGAFGINGQPAAARLVTSLRSGTRAERASAAVALGHIGGAAASAALLDALEDEHPPVRRAAARALGELLAIPAMERLLALLEDDPDRWVRRAAGDALGELGRPAVGPLLDLLEGEDLVLKDRAARALGRMGPAAVRAVPALVNALEDRETQERAARALGGIGPRASDAVPALSVVFVSSDQPVWARRRAAEALGKIGTKALPALVVALGRRDDPFTRVHAARALRSMGRGAVQASFPLTWRLRDRNDRVRSAAVSALKAIGAPAVPALVEVLGRQRMRRRDPRAVQLACQILAELKEDAKRGVPALVKLLESNDPFIKRTAVETLGEIGEPAGPAVKGLVRIAKARWPDRGWFVRRPAVRAIGRLGPAGKPAVPALVQLLNDPRPGIRRAAQRALGRISSAL